MPSGSKMPPSPFTTAVASLLHGVMIRRRMRQVEVAQMNRGTPGFISQSQLSRFFAGTRGIDIDQLAALCDALDVDVVDVIEAASFGSDDSEKLRRRYSADGGREFGEYMVPDAIVRLRVPGPDTLSILEDDPSLDPELSNVVGIRDARVSAVDEIDADGTEFKSRPIAAKKKRDAEED